MEVPYEESKGFAIQNLLLFFSFDYSPIIRLTVWFIAVELPIFSSIVAGFQYLNCDWSTLVAFIMWDEAIANLSFDASLEFEFIS